MGPNEKQLTIDDETVQIVEIIENCEESCDDSYCAEEYFIEE